MYKSNFFRLMIIVMIMMANIGCDQVSKNMVRQKLDYNEDIKLIYNRVTLTKVENPGAFLSLGDQLPPMAKNILFITLPVLALISCMVFLIRKASMPKVPLIALCFVIGGGIGNIYDRIVHGSVTDFLHIDFYIFQTGIFNMADVSVTTGIIVLFFYYLLTPQPPEGEVEEAV